MGKTLIVDIDDAKKLLLIKKAKNLSLTKLEIITKVSRGILERFLNGGNINHQDYKKIVIIFPEISECCHKKDTLVNSWSNELMNFRQPLSEFIFDETKWAKWT
tara:strand:+ start:2914 stop:3225 length:312 start_codon:yes stop_codon:yes gene_type:complete